MAGSPAGLDIGTSIGENITNPFACFDSSPEATTVRGYAYESLGPLDATGLPEGGRNLLVGSIENEHPVVKDEWWWPLSSMAAMPSTARNSSRVTVTVWAFAGIRRSGGCV